MKKLSAILLTVLLTVIGLTARTQSLGQANELYKNLAYSKAIEIYEKVLKTKLKTNEKSEALINLAHSYRQVRDMPNAEKAYRAVITEVKELTGDNTNCYLHFAQALAANGKYDESRDAYDKYSTVQQEDKRGEGFTKLFKNTSSLSKNSSSYSVEFLDINTNRAEFSPAYYKKGLVFVSARNEGIGVKRVYSWNNTAFLDLYELPDLSALGSGNTASLGGTTTKKASDSKNTSDLGRDFYTAPTANDSKIIGFSKSTGYEPVSGPAVASKELSKSINSKYHEGPVTFFKDGNKMIFTRNNHANGNTAKSKDGTVKLKLYIADGINGDWKNIKELPFNSNEYSTGHPSLSKDDKMLYFISDMAGGLGGTDIYVTKYEGGSWSTPINLGPSVNTKGNEMFPYIDDKGGLYFSSDGHPGLGELDVFYVKLLDGVIAKKPVNLGAPINSNKDDFGLITDGERKNGFFSSNRRNGGSDDDIYRFTRNGPMYACQDVIVKVFDAETQTPLGNATIQIANKTDADASPKELNVDAEGNTRLCLDVENDFVFRGITEGYLSNNVGFTTKDADGTEPMTVEIPLDKVKPKNKTFTLNGSVLTQKDRKAIAGVKIILKSECDTLIRETETDANGHYSFDVPVGCDYKIEALKDNFGTLGSKVTSGQNADITMFEKGDVIRIDNIYYDVNKTDIRTDAANELDKLVEMMNKYPKMKIELGSHTDSRSSAKYNKTLSTKRAQAAVSYIVKKGIESKRIVAVGYGESKLVNKCKDQVPCVEEEHQQNRRTEIKILNL
jgi:outer membrane protein OmpA-like peptidoglycan-associated protein